MADFVVITSQLKAKGVELQVLAMNLDTTTPTGKLMLNLMGSFAEFEREIMLERQREGVAKTKAEGKYKGRVPTAQPKAAEVVQLRGQGGEACVGLFGSAFPLLEVITSWTSLLSLGGSPFSRADRARARLGQDTVWQRASAHELSPDTCLWNPSRKPRG